MTSVDSMIMDTLSHFSGCDMSSLFRSYTVWNTMRVDKEFCKSTDDGFVRSIACRKGKCLTRTVRTEHCSFRGAKWSYQAADWSPQEMELSIGLCLLLADLALSSTYSQVSLGKWQSVLSQTPSLLPWPLGSWTQCAVTEMAGERD